MAEAEAGLHPVRPASTVVLWRHGDQGPQVLMGQRGSKAAFMPSKFVFPGGAVDAEDAVTATDAACLSDLCHRRLQLHCAADAPAPLTLAAAALRELAEETGLRPAPGLTLQFVFRAITPPGRSRRFDARFFLCPASMVKGDLANFADASDELSLLQWIGLDAARSLDLPFVTEVVLSEVAALLAGKVQPGVPFFDNSGSRPTFRRLS